MLTAQQVADHAGLTARAINKRADALSQYVVGRDGKAKLYSRDVLQVFGACNTLTTAADNTPAPRKARADAGLPRGRNVELVHYATRLARDYFMADADAIASTGRPKGVLAAVRQAIAQVYREIEQNCCPVAATIDHANRLTVDWVYDWIVRKDTERHANKIPFVGDYYRSDWQGEWQRVWKRHDFALNRGGVRYDFWRILETDFDCKQGSGFGRYVFIDDRVSKTFVNTGEDVPRKVTMLVAWDLLTGTLLHIEPVHEVTSQAYVRTVLAVAFKFGVDRTTWFLENAKAAIGDRLRQFIRTLYTDADLAWFERKEHRDLFAGQDYIVRNVPSIPHGVGKALGESFNASLRDIDGLLFPASFMGTERSQAVQLQRSSTALRKNEIAPTHDEYYKGLLGAAYGELINREMLTRRSWTKAKGITATRANMTAYYMPEQINRPTEQQLAYLLYYAQEKQPSKFAMRERGTLAFTVDGCTRNLKHQALYSSSLAAYKFSAVELPWQPGHFAVYTRYKDAVKFLCVAEDFTATTAADAARMRAQVRVMREADDAPDTPLHRRVQTASGRLSDATQHAEQVSRDARVDALTAQPVHTVHRLTDQTVEVITNDDTNNSDAVDELLAEL